MAQNTEKIDLFKHFKAEYKATAKPAFVQTTPATYLMIEGRGAPGGDEFQECIGALYSMAFTIKMTRKAAGLGDYTVCKLEDLLYGPDGNDDFGNLPKEDWHWTLMIRTSEYVKQADLDKAVKSLLSKGKCEKVREVKLAALNEGKCVQILHVGPYDQIGDTALKMQEFTQENGLSFTAKHHDIYLSDPRRVPPERLKTILRRPVV